MTDQEIVKVKFKSLSDFKKRIAGIIQDAKSHECYDFEFPDDETEEEFNKLARALNGEIGVYDNVVK